MNNCFPWVSYLRGICFVVACVGVFARPVFGGDELGLESRPMAARAWRVSDGLPQDSVTSLAVTPDGFLWMGTEEGLARFDGDGFRVFTRANTPAMTHHYAHVLLATHDGAVLAGTYGGGLLRVESGRFTSCDGGGVLANSRVQALAEARDGTIWVATAEALLRLESCAAAEIVRVEPLEHADIRALAVDRSGALWIGTWGRGVLRVAPTGEPGALTSRQGLPSDTVMSLAEEPARGMWIGTSNGPALVGDDGSISTPARDELERIAVSAMLSDGHGGMWLATSDGVMLLKGESVTRVQLGAEMDHVTARCLVGAHGAVWFGTEGRGLLRLGAGIFAVADLSDGSRVATVAAGGGGRLWLGTSDGEVYRSDGVSSVALGLRPDLRGSEVRTLEEGSDGALWIGTWLGLYRWQDGGVVAVGAELGLEGRVVRSIFEDRQGVVWVGTDGGGLVRIEDGRVKRITASDGLAGNQVRQILEGRDGTLWISTYGGLSAVRGERVSNLTRSDGLPSDMIRCLMEDASGGFWVGTYGGGIARIKDGHIQAITSREGLASDMIYSLIDDGCGSLWMGSASGVFRVETREVEALFSGRVEAVHSILYGTVEGLPEGESFGNGPSAARTDDGRLWFATVAGLGVVNPASVPQSQPAPVVIVEGLMADGVSLDRDGVVRLPAGTRRLEIEYAGARLAAPGPLRYRYRLVGWDEDWVDVGDRRSARFARLAPGAYRFEVEALGPEGPTNAGRSSIEIVMPPLVWQTAWFRMLLAGFVVASLFGLYRGRVRRFEARENELARRVAEEVSKVRVLQGLIPMCASCKKIRDDAGYWTQLEEYIRDHSEADFSHGFCPECLERLYGEWLPHRFPARDSTGTEGDSG